MENQKIIIIDGNSLINRAFYALPLLSTKEGIYTNAVYGFINMLYKIIEDYGPNYITVAFDRKAPTFRHAEYDDYKAGRKKMPEELAQQFPILKEVLEALRIHKIEIDGFEADDLIGTLVEHSENKGFNSMVVTGDKDALQLASNMTKILITKKGISSLDMYDETEIKEKLGITPDQIIDLKGLMGDKSDNIPGVPGIGEKTALKLITEFKSIENILNNLDKVPNKKMREKLEEHASQALLSKRLATIVKDVPVEIDFEELQYRQPDYQRLVSIFNKLEFHSLLRKIKVAEVEVPKVELESNLVKMINNEDDLDILIEKISCAGSFCLKVLSEDDDVKNCTILGIALSFNESNYFINTFKNPTLLKNFKEILEDENLIKFGHQIKSDILALRRNDIELMGIGFDTAIALYLLEPTRSNYDLNELAAEFLGEKINHEADVLGKGKSKKNIFDIESEQLIRFAAKCCSSVEKLRSIFAKKLEELNLKKLYDEVEVPLIEVLADMEFQGFSVDKNVLIQIGENLSNKIEHLTAEIFLHAGEKFNINSTKQLGEILFERLGLPTLKKTKTGYSTDIEVLEKLKDKHPVIQAIIKYRHLVKLKSTYIDGLLAVINNRTTKIHSSFNQTVTATGRISSTEPNLQNIPIKMDDGREIRKVFIPSNEDYLLLDADYSQIELRVLAHITQDENLIEAFHTNQDIHTITAAKVFNIPISEVTSLQRSRAKAVNFGIVYGISDYGLSENLQISRKEAQKYIHDYFNTYKGVKRYMEDVVLDGKNKGYVVTLFNRIRYIPELKSSNFNIRSFGERTAMNTPIQGTAADIIKIAMVKVYHELKRKKLKSKLILQVHDELIVEVHKSEIEETKDILMHNMENAVSLTVPLKVDMKLGINWYDTK